MTDFLQVQRLNSQTNELEPYSLDLQAVYCRQMSTSGKYLLLKVIGEPENVAIPKADVPKFNFGTWIEMNQEQYIRLSLIENAGWINAYRWAVWFADGNKVEIFPKAGQVLAERVTEFKNACKKAGYPLSKRRP